MEMPGPLITLPLAALVAAVGIRALVLTARLWQGRPGRRMSQGKWNPTVDTEARLSYDRGGLALGFELLFFAVFIEAIGVAGALPAQDLGYRLALIDVAAIAFLGFMISIGLFLTIKYYNRPKMLVPPPMRGEPGVIAGRRRRRESLGKPL